MRYVIIGASAAGLEAVKTLRDRMPEAEITVISEDAQVHSRCMLHKFLSHERSAEKISFVSDDFFEKLRIDWKKGVQVTSIEPERQTVSLSDGGEVQYDKLLIASGASYFIPPVPGLRDSGKVFGFRDLSDARRIDEIAANSANAVIIGAGLVGLDAAYALIERGLNVTVIEMADRISPLQLDKTAAQEYQNRFENEGASFVLSAKVTSIQQNEQGDAAFVCVDNGEKIPCDFVVIAAGVRPNYDFVKEGQLELDRKIVVNDNMQTSNEHIFAAGDVTGLSGTWPNAMKQGVIAANNMMGIRQKYMDRYALKNTMNFFGLVTLSLGLISQEGENIKMFCREDKNVYQKIVMQDNLVIGVILQGDVSGSGIWQYIIKNKIDVTKINKPIFELSFADFYGINERNAQYQWKLR